MKGAIETPRDARLFLNQAEAWFRLNTYLFSATDQVTLRGMFEYAHTPAHATDLRDELARRIESSFRGEHT